jgi:hypothetical protein
LLKHASQVYSKSFPDFCFLTTHDADSFIDSEQRLNIILIQVVSKQMDFQADEKHPKQIGPLTNFLLTTISQFPKQGGLPISKATDFAIGSYIWPLEKLTPLFVFC